MRRLIALMIPVLTLACHRRAGDDPSTLLDECEKLDGRANADECYERFASKTAKPGYCERIVGPRAKNQCFEKLAPVADDEGLCAKVDESTARGACLSVVAKKRGKSDPCKKVEKLETQATCIKDVAVAKGEASLCDEIKIVPTQLDCIATLAKDQPSLCERLTAKDVRDQCFVRASSVHDAAKDVSPLCERISDAQLRDNCWSSSASRKGPQLCDKIAESAARQRCIRTAVLITPADEAACAKMSRPEDVDSCSKELAQKRDANGPPPAKLAEIREGITRVSPTEFTLARRIVDKMFENIAELAKTMRFVPEAENGKVVGIRVFGIRANSVAAALGIENGDRLERINGYDLSAPDKSLEAFSRVRTSDKLVLELHRHGQPMKIVYTIK